MVDFKPAGQIPYPFTDNSWITHDNLRIVLDATSAGHMFKDKNKTRTDPRKDPFPQNFYKYIHSIVQKLLNNYYVPLLDSCGGECGIEIMASAI